MIASTLIKYIFYSVILCTTFLCGAFFYVINNYTIDFSVLEHQNQAKPSVLLDDQGNVWAEFKLDKRDPISLNKMPPHLIQAFLAVEDSNFFNHNGISIKGICRSLLVNMYHGKIVQGASTITQQLVKLLFLCSKRTFTRKLKEQLYALLIERKFTKEQILEMYLNNVYFGCGIYGVQAACQRFWGKDVTDITIGQAAMLAGIVRSPNNYCPLLHCDAAQKRKNIVLFCMKRLNVVDAKTYDSAFQETCQIIKTEQPLLAPHLQETIRLFLEETFGKQAVYCDGLVVQTTLNRSMQQEAQKVFGAHCQQLKKTINDNCDGGLISMEPLTGHIKAMIGGYDFFVSKFNRALQSRRQMGSTIKPLIFAAALKSGMQFCDIEFDEPYQLVQPNGSIWEPHNYNNEFEGPITLAYALAHSNNIVTIKTLLKTGIDSVINLIKSCNIQAQLHNYPSLALGCIDTTLKEVTGMFNIFTTMGTYIEPHFITWIKNQWGKKIYKATPEQHTVLDQVTSSKVGKVLMHALEKIHASWPESWLKCQAISKTGTTNDSRVCWYAGATPNLTTVVCIACDDNSSMGINIYPLHTAFPIWLALNRNIEQPKKNFDFDATLKESYIDEKTGKFQQDLQTNSIKILV